MPNNGYKYHVYKRGGVWLVRRHRENQSMATAVVICGGYRDIRMCWLRIASDMRRIAAAKAKALREQSRATGGRFHGADC